MFVANTFPKSKVNCVDTWIKTDEYEKEINFTEIEENFNFNISSYDNIKKFKKSSDDFFEQNKKIYEVIYVDGYHFGKQVYKDIKNAWKFLSNEGYLICDDYIWNISTKNIETTPCYAINKFLMEIKNCYKIIFVSNSQICLKKRM